MATVDKVAEGVKAFLDWVASLPPDQFTSFEYAIGAYLVAVKFISPAQEMTWVAVGLAGYGVLKAVSKLVDAVVSVKALKYKGSLPLDFGRVPA